MNILIRLKTLVASHFSWKNAATAVLIAAALVWTAATVVTRARAEAANNTVEICIDYDEAAELCRQNAYDPATFLERCQAIGVASACVGEETVGSLAAAGKIIYFPYADYMRLKILDFLAPGSFVRGNLLITQDQSLHEQLKTQLNLRYAVPAKSVAAGKYRLLSLPEPSPKGYTLIDDSLPVGFSKDKTDFLSAHGLKVVARPLNHGNPRWLFAESEPTARVFLWEGREVPGYPGNETTLIQGILERKTLFVDMEFSPVSGADKINRSVESLLVRGHTITVAELNRNLLPAAWLSRWKRAVMERNNRFILFHFYPRKSIEENLTYLRDTSRMLKNSGMTLGEARPPDYPAGENRPVMLILVVAAALISPLAGLRLAAKLRKPLLSYLTVNAVTLIGGMLIAALLFDRALMQKIVAVPGIKPAMLIPLFGAVLMVYPPSALKRFWAAHVQVKHIIFAAVGFGILALLIVRSGNNPAPWLQPEMGLRQFVEDLFIVRPRTKEFLFGQPLLFLGFALKNPLLLLLGMFAQVSIINTFMHAHAPVSISLVRSLHGIWVGLIIGYLAWQLLTVFTSRFRKEKR